VYSYAAENPDELSLQVGEVIHVMEMKIEDVGWWKGELNGKVGVFPDNFVELLPPPEVSGTVLLLFCVSAQCSVA